MTNIERKTITTGSRTSNTKKTEELNGNLSPEERRDRKHKTRISAEISGITQPSYTR